MEQENLEYYQAFTYNCVLEPRKLVSNDISTRNIMPEYSEIPTMPYTEVQFFTKANAILNSLQLQKPPQVTSALGSYYSLRHSHRDSTFFYNDFMNIVSHQATLRQLGKRITKHQENAQTNWQINLLFSLSRVGILYNISEDELYNDKGEEIGTVLLNRVIKKQLEQFGDWRVVTVKDSTWRRLTEEEKSTFVRQLNQKLGLF